MLSKKTALFYVFLCIGLWATLPSISKLGQSNLDSHQFLFWSSLVSFLSLLSATVFVKQTKTFATYKISDFLKIIVLGFLGTYLYYILLYFGYANSNGLEVIILQYTWPVFIVLLSLVILKEKLTIKLWMSVFLGFIGVFLILSKGKFSEIQFDNLLVNLLVIGGAFSFALFSVLNKKVEYEQYTFVTLLYLSATGFSFFSMICFSELKLPTINSIFPILMNGILINGFSYIFWFKALKNLEASFVAPFVFITPVLSSTLLIIFFDEPILKIYLFGLLFVVAGGLINAIEKDKMA
jgi:drug/metabolite transporter (DMT)-like permease